MDQVKVEFIESLRGAYSDTCIRKRIRDVFGVKKSAANEIFRKIFPSGGKAQNKKIDTINKGLQSNTTQSAANPPPESKSAKATFSGDKGTAEAVTSEIKTLDQLLAACQVDQEVWQVKEYTVNKWSVARSNKRPNIAWTNGVPHGNVQDDGKMFVQDLFQVKAFLVRRKEAARFKELAAMFRKQAEEFAPKNFEISNYPVKTSKEKLLEISIPDLHLAKLCWPKETRFDGWDIKLSPEGFKEAAYGILAQGRAAGATRILLPIGNDFFNSDNAAGTTTAGTPQSQSEDSRWQKTFMTGCSLLVEVITAIAKEFPVDVVVVPGNHDFERCLYLGEYISAWFRNHPGVTVNNQPTQRKYYMFGANLIGFTHGNEEKHEKLPLLMAGEVPQEWATTKYREWHLGHLHHEITKEFNGVKVRVLPSLCPPDAWHVAKGYVGSIRSAEGFLYDSDRGLQAVYYYNL